VAATRTVKEPKRNKNTNEENEDLGEISQQGNRNTCCVKTVGAIHELSPLLRESFVLAIGTPQYRGPIAKGTDLVTYSTRG